MKLVYCKKPYEDRFVCSVTDKTESEFLNELIKKINKYYTNPNFKRCDIKEIDPFDQGIEGTVYHVKSEGDSEDVYSAFFEFIDITINDFNNKILSY